MAVEDGTVALAIIGGGPAGLGAAVAAKNAGIDDILIIDREERLGGILNQCIHDGFGLELFKESLTGPEFMERYVKQVEELGIPSTLQTMVLALTPDRRVTFTSPNGIVTVKAETIILAMGCRERTRGAIRIPGSRPAGVYTAGVAQNFLNLKNYMVGKHLVILGSGDIGLIMARRFTLEGAKVEAVIEILPYCSGLTRNLVQCLKDFGIPLHLSHTVTKIHGHERVEAVTVGEVDENFNVVPGTERVLACDTLLLSVGLIPENELSKLAGVEIDPCTNGAVVDNFCQTSVDGIFACGNVLHVHDIVDSVVLEAERAGLGAVRFIEGTLPERGGRRIRVRAGDGIRYVVPQFITPVVTPAVPDESNPPAGILPVVLSFRILAPGRNVVIGVTAGEEVILRKKFRRAVPSEMIKFNLKLEENRLPADNELVVTILDHGQAEAAIEGEVKSDQCPDRS